MNDNTLILVVYGLVFFIAASPFVFFDFVNLGVAILGFIIQLIHRFVNRVKRQKYRFEKLRKSYTNALFFLCEFRRRIYANRYTE